MQAIQFLFETMISKTKGHSMNFRNGYLMDDEPIPNEDAQHFSNQIELK